MENMTMPLNTQEQLLERLADGQLQLMKAIPMLKVEIEGMIAHKLEPIEKKFKKHEEILNTRLFLTSGERRLLRNEIAKKVREILGGGEPYKAASRIVFRAVYGSLYSQYNVTTYNELPSIYFGDMIQAVRIYEPTAFLNARINEAIEDYRK